MASCPIKLTAGRDIPLHRESIEYLKYIAKTGGYPDYVALGHERVRELYVRDVKELAGQYHFSGVRRDIIVPTTQVNLDARVYHPACLRSDPAILVLFHGGGHVLGNIETIDVCCRHLADRCDCIIVNAEYRHAPEHKFPAGIEDAEAVTQWVLKNKELVGGTKASVVGVGGISSGGQCASIAAHTVKGLGFQVLVYARLDEVNIYPSTEEFKDVSGLSKESVIWFRSQRYNDVDQDSKNARYSAMMQPRFDHLPVALFILAECDRIIDESYEYSKRLTDAGVENDVFVAKGALHSFFNLPGIYRECCDKAYDAIADFIKKRVYMEK